MPENDPSHAPAAAHSASSGGFLSAATWRLRWLAHWLRLSLHLPRMAGRVFLWCWIVVALLFLAVRHVVLPQVSNQRERIVAELSQALGVKLAIAGIEADWPGLRPVLQLRGVQIFDAEGREALALPQVDASVAWTSLLNWRLELRSLNFVRPDLSARREADGSILVAGFAVQGQGDGKMADRLLQQHEISITDGRVSWTDLQRKAPVLLLEKLNFTLQNRGEVHRFVLNAQPAKALSGPLDLRGDLRGAGLDALEDWRGSLFVDVRETDLAVWRAWLDYPVSVQRGRGSLRAWLNFEGGRIGALTTDLALADVETRLAEQLPQLSLKSLAGRLRFSKNGEDYAFSAERLRLLTRDGLEVLPTQLAMRHQGAREGRPAGGSLDGEKLDMRVLSQLAAYLPLPVALRERLAAIDPSGQVARIKASWQEPADGSMSMPPKFTLNAEVANLSLRSADGMPGLAGFSGRIEGDEKQGDFDFAFSEGSIDLPGILHEAHVPVAKGALQGEWERASSGELSVTVSSLQLDNADMQGAAFSGVWRGQPGTAGRLDMKGMVPVADPRGVWRYIPEVVPKDVSDWLKMALTSGRGEKVTVVLNGELADFPFNLPARAGMPRGVFRVEGGFSGIDLAFAEGWPALQNLQGRLLFDRTAMQIKARSGQYGKAKLRDVEARIADLDKAGSLPLEVTGVAEGPGEQMLDYLRATPVAKYLGSFIQHLHVGGDGKLDLKLAIPLLDAENTRVNGSYQFDDNTVQLARGLPAMHRVRGAVGFNEKGIAPTQARGEFLGGNFTTTGKSLPDGTALFEASGVFPAGGLHEIIATPLWSSLSGEAAVTARISVSSARAEVAVTSDLVGIGSRLPAPASKLAHTRWPFSFTWAMYDEPGVRAPTSAGLAALTAPLSSIEDWQLSLEGLGGAHWQDRCIGERCNFLRGAVAINDGLSLPSRGMRISGRFGSLDIDAWRPVLTAVLNDASKGSQTASKSDSAFAGAVLQADEIIAGGHRFEQVMARAVQQGSRWTLRLQGPDVAGDLAWLSEDHGRLQAKLSVLRLKPVENKARDTEPAQAVAGTEERLPALDVRAEQFEMKGMKLGALSLQAQNEGPLWRLPVLRIESDDGVISGDGQTRSLQGGGQQTEVSLRVDTGNIGGMLGRFGFPDAIRRGKAVLSGRLSWRSAATSVDYASLTGELRLDAEDGQFNKLEPGAARLLGVLSLQSLPRRISLDFRDVFSDGFAFDAITGDMKIDKGVLYTSNLDLRGPAAKAYMKGSTDLSKEIHALTVNVQPTLSEGVAVGVGAVLLNPVIGVAIYAAQKALSDPLEKLFSFDYSISGPWADPKIEKLGGASPLPLPQPQPQLQPPPQ